MGSPIALPVEGAPATPTATAKIKCEFCQCQLGPSGEYLQLSARAKELRALDDTVATLRADAEKQQATIVRLETELATLKAATQPPASQDRNLW